VIEIDPKSFWAHPFSAICTPKQLREFTIMDTEKETNKRHVYGKESHKHELSDAWVMKTSDLYTSDAKQVHTKTHLGRLINPGDTALGFDLANSNVNDENFNELNIEDLQDVVLVKKLYGDKLKRHKKRKWRLDRLKMDKEGGSVATIDDKDYLDFLEDIEEDAKVRENINIYKGKIIVELL
jgi:nonsense-mediated mRNA decay protein 3